MIANLNALAYLVPSRAMLRGLGDDGDDGDVEGSGDLGTGSGDSSSGVSDLELTQDSPIDATITDDSGSVDIGTLPTSSAAATYAASNPILDSNPADLSQTSTSSSLTLTPTQIAQLAVTGTQVGLQASGVTPTTTTPITTVAPAATTGVSAELSNWLNAQSLIAGTSNGTVLMLSAAALTLVGVLASLGSGSKSKRRR